VRRIGSALILLVAGLDCGPAEADEIVLKDGSRIIGEVLELAGGKLKVKTVFAQEILINWAEVASIATEKPLPIVLKDGTRLQGTAAPGEGGAVSVKVAELADPVPISMESISSINPTPKPAVTFKGFVSAGASVTDGNTQTRAFSANGEFEARAERQRFTLRGSTNYAENEDRLTARNSRASIKYDFFLTKRLYAFTSALFEGDEFQDLRLRTALSAGPGYQFIDTGDFQAPWLREVQFSGEAGVSYFNEDYEDSEDKSYVAARWAVKLNWPIVPKKVVLFHFHEGYPGLERAEDLYVSTEQGVRFTILENFFAAIQVNWRWDNTPATGAERDDTIYLFSLGYNFDFSTS